MDGIEDKNRDSNVDSDETDPNNPDTDGDNILDGIEDSNQDGIYNPELAETNPLDTDSDGDGINDDIEDKNYNGTYDSPIESGLFETDASNTDTDGDGILDGLEDANKNGVVDTGETDPRLVDTDEDGILDGIEDDNQDGVFDEGVETDPRNIDTDKDTISDGDEDKNKNGQVDNSETNPRTADTDGDGIDDNVELSMGTNGNSDDSDGDGLTDNVEMILGTNPLSVDSDGDGLADNVEVNSMLGLDPTNEDTDWDGIIDGIEDMNQDGVFDQGVEISANMADTDKDGIEDGEEDKNKNGIVDNDETDPKLSDTDGDGLDDGSELLLGTNSIKIDTDSDGLTDGDEVNIHDSDPNDVDSDNDGLTDGEEVNTYASNPIDSDSDNDGLSDGLEVNTYSTDPNNKDSDSDGINDKVEIVNYSTDPNNEDSDNDGVIDGDEITLGIDPNDADSDNDGLDDGIEINTYNTDPDNMDTDKDGINDGEEVSSNNGYVTDPSNNDSDSDGVTDGVEILTYNSNPLLADTDGDGVSDNNEINMYQSNPTKQDTDGDGINDNIEVTNGYDPTKQDSDGDTLLDNEEDVNLNGITDEGETSAILADTDNDGIDDNVEIDLGTNPLLADTDNDGVSDGDEVSANLDPFVGDSNDDGVSDLVIFSNINNLTQFSIDAGGGAKQSANYSLKYQSLAPNFGSFETKGNHQLISGIHFDAEVESLDGYELPFETEDVTLNTTLRGMIATKLEIMVSDASDESVYYNVTLNKDNSNTIEEIWGSKDTLNNQEKVVKIKARAFDGLTWGKWYEVADEIIVDNLPPDIDTFMVSNTIFSPNNDTSIGVKDSTAITLEMVETYLKGWTINVMNSNDEIKKTFSGDDAEGLSVVKEWFGKDESATFVDDGDYRLKVAVQDNVSNLVESEIDVSVDNTSPEITISIEAEGKSLNSGEVDVRTAWIGIDNYDSDIDYSLKYNELKLDIKEINTLELWLDASDVNTLETQGVNLVTWYDKSNKANHFTQEVAGNRPVVNENAILTYETIAFESNKGLYSSKEMTSGLKYIYAVVKGEDGEWVVIADIINMTSSENVQIKNGNYTNDIVDDTYNEFAEIVVFSTEQSDVEAYLNAKWQRSNLADLINLPLNSDEAHTLYSQEDNNLYQFVIEGEDDAGNKQIVYSDTIIAPDRTAPEIHSSLTTIIGEEDESFSINLDDKKIDNIDSDINLRWIPSIIYNNDNPAQSSEEILNNITAINNGQEIEFTLINNANTESSENGNIYGKENAYVALRLEDSEGNFTEKNVQLVINAINDPPEFISTIGSPVYDTAGNIIYNIKFDEDTVGPIITLDDYIQDVDNLLTDLDVTLETEAFYMDLLETDFDSYKSQYLDVSIGDELSGHEIQFIPYENWYGDQALEFKVADSNELSITESVIVRIWPVNDPPIIKDGIDDFYTYDEDIGFSLTFTDYEDDVEFEDKPPTHNDLLNWDVIEYDDSIISDITIIGDTITFTPIDNKYGTANIVVQLTDSDTIAEELFPQGSVYGGYIPNPQSVTKSIDLVWVPVNDPPTMPVLSDVINNENQSKSEDSATWQIDLSSYKSDIEDSGDDLIYGISMSDNYLTYSYDESTNVITFTPRTNAFGTTQVSITLTDSDTNINFEPYTAAPESITQTFDIVLEAVNDEPVITSIELKSIVTNLKTLALTTDELRVEAVGFSDVGYSDENQIGNEYDTTRAAEPFFTPNTEQYKFEWLIDGVAAPQNTNTPQSLNFDTLVIDESMEGKTIAVKVWPHDGVSLGDPIEATLVVNNRPSMVAENTILPEYNDYFPTVNVDLSWVDSTDLDAGDDIKYRLKVWKVPKWHSAPTDTSLEASSYYYDSLWKDKEQIISTINAMQSIAEEELHGTYYWRVWAANEFVGTYYDYVDTSWTTQFNIDLIAPGLINDGSGTVNDDFLSITNNMTVGLAENIRILYGTKPTDADDGEAYKIVLKETNQPIDYPANPITVTENTIIDSVEFDSELDESYVYWTYIITFPAGTTTYNILLEDFAGNISTVNTFVITPDTFPPPALKDSEAIEMANITAITSANMYSISGFKEPSAGIIYEGTENGIENVRSDLVGYTPVSEFTFNIYPEKPSGNLIVKDRAGNENEDDIIHVNIEFLRGDPVITSSGLSRDIVNAKENESKLRDYFGLNADQFDKITTSELEFSVNRDISKYELIVSDNILAQEVGNINANTSQNITIEANREVFEEGQNTVTLKVTDAANNIAEQEYILTLQSEEPDFNVFQNGSFLAKISEDNWNLSLTGIMQDNIDVFINNSQDNLITANTYWVYVSTEPFDPSKNDIYVTLIDKVYNYVSKPIWLKSYYSSYADRFDIALPIQELYNAEAVALTYHTLPDGIAELVIVDNSNSTNSLRELITGLYTQPLSLVDYKFDDSQLSIPTELTDYSVTVVAKDEYGNIINHVDLSEHGVAMKLEYPESVLYDSDDLVIIEYDDVNMEWRQNEETTIVETLSNSVITEINNTGVYALAELNQLRDTLENLRVYPNPWIPLDGKANTGWETGEESGIVFDQLKPETEISIYTITGELVITHKTGALDESWNWNGKNNVGHNVFSGVYIYLVKNQDEVKTGKLTIVR
ncbi:hypothetical protein CL647_03515 [bacterium]|nr:hypothetical protein [bacterium]